jgi:hypothetical protein
MIGLLCFVLGILASPFKSKIRLAAENAALRHQLIVLRRKLRGSHARSRRLLRTNHMMPEQARRAAWQRTVENAASFGDPLGRNTWVGCTIST